MSKIRNYKRSSIESRDGTVLLSTTRYEDVNWTTFLDPATNYKTTIYVIETWVPLTRSYPTRENGYERGTTRGILEVARPTGEKSGWCVRLFGEELPERYTDKGHAQHAAEGLAS